MLEISLNVYYTIALAIVVLMVGDFIKKHIYVLRKFCIPTPVVGGVLFALLITVLNMSGLCKLSLDSSFNNFFSLLFYAGIGYTASWKLLRKGGPQVILFLILSSILVVFQNGLGMLKNNLISLLDIAFPDANRLFTSPPRADGSEKWVDFVAAFWHCECVCGLSEKAFTAKYYKWCRKHGYNFSEDKALDIYASACGHFGVIPKTDTAKLLVEQAVSQIRATSATLAALKQEMQSLAASLPEYPVVMGMFGVGPTLGPQLMAEIGDVRRFHSKKALVAFAGIDAPPYQSGQIVCSHAFYSNF